MSLEQIAKAIQAQAATTIVVRTGTALSGINRTTGAITVALDNDPNGKPVSAISVATGLIQPGDRVFMLAYPPRGLVVIGKPGGNAQFDSLTAVNETVSNLITIGSLAGAHVFINSNQIWAMNAGVGADLVLNFSSSGNVRVGDGTVTGAGLQAVRLTPTDGFDATGFALASTSFVTSATAAFTFQFPPSGTLLVHYSALANNSVAAQRAVMTIQIRQTNVAGVPLHAFQESESASATSAVGGQLNTIARTLLITGMPTSGVGYIEPCGRAAASGTAQFQNIRIVVQPTL